MSSCTTMLMTPDMKKELIFKKKTTSSSTYINQTKKLRGMWCEPRDKYIQNQAKQKYNSYERLLINLKAAIIFKNCD